MDPTAVDLLQFVPTRAKRRILVSTVPVKANRGDQVTLKFDHRFNDKQNLSFYYYFNDDTTNNPFASFQLAGANLPRVRRHHQGTFPAVEYHSHLDDQQQHRE